MTAANESVEDGPGPEKPGDCFCDVVPGAENIRVGESLRGHVLVWQRNERTGENEGIRVLPQQIPWLVNRLQAVAKRVEERIDGTVWCPQHGSDGKARR